MERVPASKKLRKELYERRKDAKARAGYRNGYEPLKELLSGKASQKGGRKPMATSLFTGKKDLAIPRKFLEFPQF